MTQLEDVFENTRILSPEINHVASRRNDIEELLGQVFWFFEFADVPLRHRSSEPQGYSDFTASRDVSLNIFIVRLTKSFWATGALDAAPGIE